MKRRRGWLDQFDWGAIVGSALCLAFYLCVIGPVIINAPVLFGHHQQQQAARAEHAKEQSNVVPAQGGDEALATYTFWLVIFTAILAVSTIGLWIVTAKTLSHAQRDARRQAADSRRQQSNAIQSNLLARRAADAARDAVIKAHQTFDQTERHARYELRAYLTVETISFDTTPKWLVVIITLQNNGKTPARNIRQYASWSVFPNGLPSGFGYPNVYGERGDEASKSVAGPGQSVLNVGIHVDHPFVVEVADGQNNVFIWGWAEYDDTLGGRRHRTEFAYWLLAERVGAAINCRTRLHSEFNGIDRDCIKPVETEQPRA